MKKLLMALVLVGLMAGVVWGGASSWTVAYSPPMKAGAVPLIKTWSLTFVGSGSDGNVTSYTTTASDKAFLKDYYLYVLEDDPGAVAPSDNWDITVVDSLGLEIATMSNFDNSTSEKRYFRATGETWYPPMDGTSLVIGVSGTTVPSGTATLKFWLSK